MSGFCLFAPNARVLGQSRQLRGPLFGSPAAQSTGTAIPLKEIVKFARFQHVGGCCGDVHFPKQMLPHPLTPSVLCTAPKAREVRVVKLLHFPVRDPRERATGISCFPCQTATRSYLYFPAHPRLFSPTFSPPPGCFFARNLVKAEQIKKDHMQKFCRTIFLQFV